VDAIRFEIDVHAAEMAGLGSSSQLLKLAVFVKERRRLSGEMR
jgi:hypothetical protein